MKPSEAGIPLTLPKGRKSSFVRLQRGTRASWLAFGLFLLVWLTPVRAGAQLGGGTLQGQVRNGSTQEPIAAVTVTATSPSLQAEQSVVSDAAGLFRIPNLPPGEYVLRYERVGFQTHERMAIQVSSNATLRVDARLLSTGTSEVVILGQAPTVDVGSTRSGLTLSRDFTTRLPVAPPTGKGGAARSFEQLAEVAPTVRNDLYGASIAGTTSVENTYFVDGLSVGDPGFGYNAAPLSLDFIHEVTVLTGGYLPEYGRGGGGVLDVVTKSGSNDFRGSVFVYGAPFQGKPRRPPPQESIFTTRRLRATRDIGGELGGPVFKDKLWFYVGFDLSRTSYELSRTLNSMRLNESGNYVRDSDGFILSEIIPGSERRYVAEQTGIQYISKLTFSPTNNDRFELTHHGTPTWSGGNGKYSLDYETGVPNLFDNPTRGDIVGSYGATAYRQVFDAFDTSLRFTHATADQKFTLDTILGWHHERSANLPADGSRFGAGGIAAAPVFFYGPPTYSITDFEAIGDPSLCENPVPEGDVRCPVSAYAVGGPQMITDRRFNRYQLRSVASYFAKWIGHHVLKAGVELEYSTYSSQRGFPGGVFFDSDEEYAYDFSRFGGMTGPDQAYTIRNLRRRTQSGSFGGFIQDSWSILDVITVNAGARYDTQLMYSEEKLGIALTNQWSPRIGVIYDPTRSGRSRLFANYAIYYQSLPLNIMDRQGSGEPFVSAARERSFCQPGTTEYPASCDAPENLSVGGDPSDPNRRWWYQTVGKLAVDPDLQPQSSSELSAGVDFEVMPHGRIGVTYIRRWMNRVIEDMSRDEGRTYFLGNPGHGIASDFPEAERNYDAGIVSFTKAFSDSWLAQASYTLSYLRGNWEGLYRDTTAQLDPGANTDFDAYSLTVNRYGPLPGDRRHEIKLFLARDIAVAPQHRLDVGTSVRSRSGKPTNYYGEHPGFGAGEVLLLPRGSGQRLPWVHTVDVHVGYTFFQTRKQKLSLTLDVFNLFNFAAVVRTGEDYSLREVEPITGADAKNPFVNGNNRNIDPTKIRPADGQPRPFGEQDRSRRFGAPLEYQDPITLRFGLKEEF